MPVEWTHLALHVRSLQASIAFYEEFTSLRVIEEHSDAASTGMNVVWLSDRPEGAATEFVLVLQEGVPHILPDAQPQLSLAPISHLGFAVPTREVVDQIAERARERDILRFGPTFLNENAGYICILVDPD